MADYKKLTITSNLDPATGQFDIKDIERDIKSMLNNAVKSALPENAFYKLSPKRLSPQGQYTVDLYLHGDSASLTQASLNRQIASEMKFKGSVDPRYSVSSPADVDRRTARHLRREELARGDETESTRKTRGTILKVLGVLTALTDITRRILSSVLTFSQRTFQDAITASNLGMSYNAVRSYRHIETAHGLKEGTITGAISDIQSKFGNITSLDENALKALAVVMGGKIEEMATMGLGASNPEKILGAILDDFNEKANRGYNSVGQYVGEQQARRELYSYLLKVSPQVADIFATMQEEQHNINSLYRNQADTFESWKNAFPTSRGGDGWGGYGSVELTAQQWQKVQEMFNQMKEHMVVALAPEVFSLLQRIANSRLFMTETEKRQLNEKNKALNEAEMHALDKTISKFESNYDNLSPGEKAYYDVLVEQRDALKRENEKSEIDNITAPEAILQSRAERRIREAGYKSLSEGESIKPISDLSFEELADVVNTYGLDTPEAREAYAKSRQKDVEKANKAVEQYEQQQKSNLYFKYDQEMRTSGQEFDEARKSGVLKKAYKASGQSARKALKLLYQLGSVYGFAYDLDNESGRNYEEKIYSALRRAEAEGYGSFSSMGQFSFNREKYIDMNFKPVEGFSKELEIDYGNEYLKWLYQHDPYQMEEINSHVRAYRADQEIERMRTNNPVQAWEWLYRTEGTKADWRKAVEALPDGTYVLRGTNTNPEYGENVYKIIVESRDNGKVVSSKEVFSTEGGWSFEGNMTRFEIRDGKIHYIDGLGTSASQEK